MNDVHIEGFAELDYITIKFIESKKFMDRLAKDVELENERLRKEILRLEHKMGILKVDSQK